jgi:uncharacterized cupin superfamily protein
MADYTVLNVLELDDYAAKSGVGDGSFHAYMPREPLAMQQTGATFIRLEPGAEVPFAHRHKQAEELYYVAAGSGTALLDGEEQPLREHDLLRLAPSVARCLRAGDDGLEVLAVGPRFEGDAEMLQPPSA